MSKKEITVNEAMQQNVLDAANDLGIEIPSIKAFALALNLPVTRLNNIAKTPVPGQMYDPSVTNWDALNEFFQKKITEGKVESMTALLEVAKEKEEYLATAGTRHTGVSTGANLIDVDGGKMPKRKSEKFEMGSEKESYICFKKDAGVYKMVYQTAGYTAIRPVGPDGNFCMELVRVVSNGTLNTKCVPPTEMDAAIKDRFSGEYQARHINDMDVVGMEHPAQEETKVPVEGDAQ